jgi:hypothetical protein
MSETMQVNSYLDLKSADGPLYSNLYSKHSRMQEVAVYFNRSVLPIGTLMAQNRTHILEAGETFIW